MSTPESHPILLCYDRSPGARRAIETVGALFPGRPTVVLYVWTPISVMIGGFGAVMSLPACRRGRDPGRRTGDRRRGSTPRGCRGAGRDAGHRRPTRSTARGTRSSWLPTSMTPALIALGARGLSTVRSMLLGSVSHAVVQHARRPVLVVPPPPGRGHRASGGVGARGGSYLTRDQRRGAVEPSARPPTTVSAMPGATTNTPSSTSCAPPSQPSVIVSTRPQVSRSEPMIRAASAP